jgi:hypothetical protein
MKMVCGSLLNKKIPPGLRGVDRISFPFLSHSPNGSLP